MKNTGSFKSSNATLYGVGVKIPHFIFQTAFDIIMTVINDLPNQPCKCKKCLKEKKN